MFSERTQDLLGEHLSAERVERPMTLDEAMALAIALHKQEELGAAEAVYGRILAAVPDHAPALHFAGVLAHQLGRHDEAVQRIERSLASEAGCADWHSNHGLALQGAGRVAEAIVAYERAIALDPSHANAYSNLGIVLRASGRLEESEAAYRKAIELNPSHIDAYTNLGILLNGQKRGQEAVACFCKAIVLRPKHRDARRLLGLAHCTLGDVAEATKIFEEWLAEEPDDPIPRHMLAACTGREVPPRASDGYVETTFDTFAASFEMKLAQLSYRAPRLIAAVLEDSGLPVSKVHDVLDAGCGTGLCGTFLAPYARTLTGVDLSAGMLAQAEPKHLYDVLQKAELTEYLRSRPGAFDIIVSADTLVYFGTLEEVMRAAAGALREGGVFLFTLEHAVDAGPGVEFRLELHGRYGHAREYVQRSLAAAGLHADICEADLRMESGLPVAGLVVRATKPRAADARGDRDA